MSKVRYEVVDVFTDRPFAGNPLAVVLDADELTGDQMQRIAREFNLSETAFVLRPAAGGTYRVRIFTPAAEMPFAGHPSVGTAATLVRLGRIAAGDVVQECGAGNLPLVAAEDAATLSGGTPRVGAELDAARLLATIGLTAADFAGVPPRSTGCGVDATHLLVRPGAVVRAAPDLSALRSVGALSVSTWDAARSSSHTRVFAPDLGVPEDPATGSAALGQGVYLVAAGLLPGDGESAYTVRQGVEMGRPSILECTVRAEGGRPVAATVRGGVSAVAVGEIEVPVP